MNDDQWVADLLRAGDKLCLEAMQMTVSVPRKIGEQAERLERAVAAFRRVCMQFRPASTDSGDADE